MEWMNSELNSHLKYVCFLSCLLTCFAGRQPSPLPLIHSAWKIGNDALEFTWFNFIFYLYFYFHFIFINHFSTSIWISYLWNRLDRLSGQKATKPESSYFPQTTTLLLETYFFLVSMMLKVNFLPFVLFRSFQVLKPEYSESSFSFPFV